MRLPIAAIGLASAGLAVANAAASAPDRVTVAAAAVVACCAATLFLCATLDPGFHRSLSALNADRLLRARELGWSARLFGLGLPVGDRLLFYVGLIALLATLAASNLWHHLPAAALGFAAFFLIGVTQIAIMVRDAPAHIQAPPPE